ncbi:MAG: phosphatidylserine/phosphatidylglycerophosphate/cardiolipin synthase family protein [Chlamydiales bacterium]|nr:phosphatidylserine/phosphatidylglycerophosphate/cardiolipin synthase family protein [Chlamydiales bacterium]
MHNKVVKWIAVILFGLIFLVWSSFYGLHCTLPTEGSSPQLFANQVDDNLQRTFIRAIGEAKESVTLIIYSLTDSRIIRALEQKKSEGIEVKVIHDPTTSQKGFMQLSQTVETNPLKMRGLMHRKILIIDKESVWIGSANFTTESLKMHSNLVVGSVSPELAETILANKQHHHFTIGGQMAEFWTLPESNKEGLERLLELIHSAEISIQVGMFTWTHPQITEAVIAAAKRGVNVEVVLDRTQAQGASKKSLAELQNSAVNVRINRGNELFHHKFLVIDKHTLVNGSANWTRGAFSRNSDCFLILHNLNEEQTKKMRRLWHIIRATSDPSSEKKLLSKLLGTMFIVKSVENFTNSYHLASPKIALVLIDHKWSKSNSALTLALPSAMNL